MAYKSDNPLYQSLDDEGEKEYRQWAIDNFKPQCMDIVDMWHPIVKDECMKIKARYLLNN
jgi:hypothetical protein